MRFVENTLHVLLLSLDIILNAAHKIHVNKCNSLPGAALGNLPCRAVVLCSLSLELVKGGQCVGDWGLGFGVWPKLGVVGG